MTHQALRQYDVFISYSHVDRAWVHGTLLSQLEAASLSVCIDDRDFEIGLPSLINMERAVAHSRRTLVVMTPAWVQSEWTEFESLLVATSDPAGRRQRLIPLMLEACQPPPRIAMLTYVDFTDPKQHEAQLRRLIRTLQRDPASAYEPSNDQLAVVPLAQIQSAPDVPSRPGLSAINQRRRTVLEHRLRDVLEEYEIANNQLSTTLGEVDRVRIKRQIESLEQEIREVEAQLQSLQA